MNKIINFIFDFIAFPIAIMLLAYWRAERMAIKIRKYIKHK